MMKPPILRIALAGLLLLALGAARPAAAKPYAILGYPLGMSFADFMAQPIPGSAGKTGWRILCADGRELHGHMMGFIGADHDIETRIGAKTCLFAEPDLVSGPKWWKPATVPYAGKPMIWIFRFLSDPQGAEARRLFAITALYRPDWEARNQPIDAIEPALVDAFGPGDAIEQEKLSGRIWRDGDQTVEFAAQKLPPSVQQASFCIGLVDEAWLVELNRRLDPFRRQHWRVCIPDMNRNTH